MRLLIASTVFLIAGCQAPQPFALSASTRAPAQAPAATNPPTSIPETEQTGQAQGCYYVWATRELSGLSARLEAELAAAGQAWQASAYAFGEECRAESGETTFHAMETDFRVRVPVGSLSDEDALGNAIQTAIAAIGALPSDQIVGPRPGRAEFEFVATDLQSKRLIVDISRFQQDAAALHGAALFSYFNEIP